MLHLFKKKCVMKLCSVLFTMCKIVLYNKRISHFWERPLNNLFEWTTLWTGQQRHNTYLKNFKKSRNVKQDLLFPLLNWSQRWFVYRIYWLAASPSHKKEKKENEQTQSTIPSLLFVLGARLNQRSLVPRLPSSASTGTRQPLLLT